MGPRCCARRFVDRGRGEVQIPMIVAPSARAGPPGAIGYVLKVFPRVSETFVINEIRALEALGERIRIFSLHHPDSAVPHGILRELRSPVCYVEDAMPPSDKEIQRARRQLERQLSPSAALCQPLLPRKYVRLAMVLAALVRQEGIDHLHAHFASRAGHVAVLAACLSGCPYSITAHAKDIYHRDVDARLLRLKIAWASFVVTVTDYNRRYLQELVAEIPGAGAKIVRIYNGVDLTGFSPGNRPQRTPPRIVSVGRLVEKKGFRVLLEACRLLRERGYEFHCEIIGGGPEEHLLQTHILTEGLQDTVTLVGLLATEEVAERLRDATVVVLPCVPASDGNIDALPTVLLEAMATARPVVSTRMSGIPEIVVDGETGLLVSPGDAQALADSLATVLDHPADADAMGRAGRRRAERLFDLFENVAELRRLFWRDVANVRPT